MKFRLNEDVFLEDTLGQSVAKNMNTPEYKETEKQADKVLDKLVEVEEEGQIETVLNEILEVNRDEIASGGDNFVNVLFEGPAGTGKTARIKKWARNHNINLVTVLASVMDETDLGGAIAPDKTNTTVTRLATQEFDELDNTPDSVLFLDEFNRAPHNVRGTLLTLIQEHKIRDDRVPGKQRVLKNFLFTIAAINPYDPRYNTEELDDAEKSRFEWQKMEYDNLGSRDWLVGELERKKQFTKDPKKLLALERKQELVKRILSSREFEFDSPKDIALNALDGPNAEKGANGLITTPRTFTNLINRCNGTKEDFLAKWNSFCNAMKKNMVSDILDGYYDKEDKATSIFNKNMSSNQEATVFAQRKKSADDKLKGLF